MGKVTNCGECKYAKFTHEPQKDNTNNISTYKENFTCLKGIKDEVENCQLFEKK